MFTAITRSCLPAAERGSATASFNSVPEAAPSGKPSELDATLRSPGFPESRWPGLPEPARRNEKECKLVRREGIEPSTY